jgi:hypothetical protein
VDDQGAGAGCGEGPLARRGVLSHFKISYQEVEEDITEFEMVHLTVTSFEARQIEFYNIKIGSK